MKWDTLKKSQTQDLPISPMVDNDVQVIVVGRLTRHLADLGVKIAKAESKPMSGKRSAVK